jgi:tetratricopeptide (TPR) repeat protein
MEALERVMANAMQIHRGGDLAAMTRIGKQAFAQANASGYAPAIIDVARVYAAYQNSDNDPIGEEATYREGLGAAELAHDDGAKAVFGLRLAAKLANNQHLDEATHFLDLAKASATRVPASPLMDAEVAYAEGLVLRARSDFRGSVAALRRFMTLRTSVFGELDRLARFEMPLLANVLDQVDPAQAVEVRKQLDALDAKADPRVSQGLDRKIPKLLDKAVHAMNSGDFEASARTYDALIAIGEHEIGASPRVAEWYRGAGVLAQIGGHLERAYAQFTHAFAIWDEFATRTKDVVATHGYSSRLLCDLGRYPEAVVHARKGLDLALELDDTESAAERRVDLGEGLLGTGDAAAARAPLEQALTWRQDHGAASARGRVKLLLARALWSDTASDRKRAIDLARSGRSDIAASIALLDPKSPVTRIAKPRQEKTLAAADAWLREHH